MRAMRASWMKEHMTEKNKKTLDKLAEIDEIDFGLVRGGAVAESQGTLLMQYDDIMKKAPTDPKDPAPSGG